MKKSLLYIVAIMLSFHSVAQTDTNKISVHYASFEEIMAEPDLKHSIDTSLELFHQYNPVDNFHNFLTNTGNIGSAIFPLTYQTDRKVLFDAGFHQFDPYFYSPPRAIYYNSFTPYANFYYAQGNKEMQVFDASVTQNINPGWNVGLDYSSYISEGLYASQNSRLKTLSVTTNYHTPNQIYQLYFSAVRNRVELNENGGVANDSLFRAYSGRSRLGLQTELSGPKNTWHQKTYSLFHSLNLNPREKDTIFPDTIVVKVIPEKSRMLYYIEHSFSYDDYYLRYEDENTNINLDYYKAIYQDSFYTSSKTHFREFNNVVYLTLRNNQATDSVYFQWRSGIMHQLVNSRDINTRTFTNLSLTSSLKTRLRSFDLSLHGIYVLSGENGGNYLFEESASKELAGRLEFEIKLLQQRKNTPYKYRYLETNLLSWSQQLNPQLDQSMTATITHKKSRTSVFANYTLISDYMYMDSSLKAVNAPSIISYIGAGISSHLEWKGFHLMNNFSYQASSEPDIIRLPAIMLNSLFYFQNKLFKDKLGFQIGLEARYRHQSYLPYYYAPYSTFYQNYDYEVPAYATFDVFINMVVKRARFFFRYEHLNQGVFPGNDYYRLPLYPQDPRAFRLGLSWMFFD